MAKLNQITIGGKLYMEIDSNPTAGQVAPIGTLAVWNDAGVGKLYLKAGAADTAWSAVVSGVVDLSPYFKIDGSTPMTGSIQSSFNNLLDIGAIGSAFRSLFVRDIKDTSNVVVLDVATRVLRNASGAAMMTFSANGSVNFGGNTLSNIADPVLAQDAASKAYVDAVALGLSPKKAVRLATTVAGTLATSFIAGQSIDGVVLVAGDRILIKNQAAPAENGIYVVGAGAPVRATDMDAVTPIDEFNGAWVPVQAGTVNAYKIFVQYGTVTTVGTSAVNFEFYNPLAALVGGDMITNSGSTFSVDLSSSSGLESTNPGLAAGQLQVKLNGATLDRSASGMKVADGGISDLQVNAAAAIAHTKMLALTASRLPVLDASGFLVASSVTAVEAGYLSGVTSAIQTQLDGKLNLTGGTMSGPINMGLQLITNLANPSAAQDATTKNYTDNNFWKLATSSSLLNTPVAESFFGSFSGNFPISFFRNNVKAMSFENVSGNEVVGIYNTGIRGLSGSILNVIGTNGLSLTSGSLGNALSLTSQGESFYSAVTKITMVSRSFQKQILESAGFPRMFTTEEAFGVSVPDANATASLSFSSSQGTSDRKVKLEIFFRNTAGAKVSMEKMLHIDSSGAILLQQDSFTSSNALGSAFAVALTNGTSTLTMSFSGMAGMTGKRIHVRVEEIAAPTY